jgi:hypothetical protein
LHCHAHHLFFGFVVLLVDVVAVDVAVVAIVVVIMDVVGLRLLWLCGSVNTTCK